MKTALLFESWEAARREKITAQLNVATEDLPLAIHTPGAMPSVAYADLPDPMATFPVDTYALRYSHPLDCNVGIYIKEDAE